ncbi:MAG: ABC transporter permease, partial [Rhodospirillales bacterium]|nr:ABC transporter permease [Rhodospirillales bacterium]
MRRIGLALAWTMLTLSVVFLLAPLAVTIAVSLSPSPVFELPRDELSLIWYRQIGALDGLLPSVLLSLEVAAIATAVSLVLGTLAAIAVVRGRFPGREAITTFLVSPLMLPGLVLGIALLQYFRSLGLREALPTLLLAHVLVVLPYVMRTLTGGLSLFDFTLLDAARTLGLSWPRAVLQVMVPVLAPSFLTGGLFGFLSSVDNYPVSIFLTDVYHKTLPIQLLQYIGESPDPTIAAVSTLMIGLTVLVLILGERLVGLDRMAGDFMSARQGILREPRRPRDRAPAGIERGGRAGRIERRHDAPVADPRA